MYTDVDQYQYKIRVCKIWHECFTVVSQIITLPNCTNALSFAQTLQELYTFKDALNNGLVNTSHHLGWIFFSFINHK